MKPIKRDRYGRFLRIYKTKAERLKADKERQRKRREEMPELVRRWAREAKRRQRAKLNLGRPHMWRMACSLCLQFGHKRGWCPLIANDVLERGH